MAQSVDNEDEKSEDFLQNEDRIEGSAEERAEDEAAFLKADNALLNRVQAALHKDLRKQYNKLTAELASKEDHKKVITKKREAIGVSLYGFQQELSKLQLTIEGLDESLAVTKSERVKTDTVLKENTEENESAQLKYNECIKHFHHAQQEKNKQSSTLRQIDQYNKALKTDIQVTRRATHKAEDALQKVEEEKQSQDYELERLTELLTQLKEKHALHTSQLDVQKQETSTAAAALKEATVEIDAIRLDMQQISQQWRTTVVGIQKRDEALENIRKLLAAEDDKDTALQSEKKCIRASTKAEQERNETLTCSHARTTKELNHLISQREAAKKDREKLIEEKSILNQSLDSTLKDTTRLDSAMSSLEHQMSTVNSNIQKLNKANTEANDRIATLLSEQITLDRSAANTAKRALKFKDKLQEMTLEVAQQQNEIARVKVDSLNTKSHNTMLAGKAAKLAEEQRNREKLVEQYEIEVRKTHNNIEKKQLNVDRLNKEYDDKKSGQDDENTGPLEAKINSSKKELDQKTTECSEMQKDWITKQTELLRIQADTSVLSKNVDLKKDQKLIFDKKKIRLERSVSETTKEMKELQKIIRKLRLDMDRLNTASSDFTKKRDKIQNDYRMLEDEFAKKLRDKKEAMTVIQQNTQKVQAEKDQLQEDIIEAEKQIMLWERKIRLEKEMQAALDPSVGQVEAQKMKKEIHRMELRYDQLKRKQEQMLVDIERVIDKRETIQVKHDPKHKATKKGVSNTQTLFGLKRSLESLKNTLKKSTTRIADLENESATKQTQAQELESKISQFADSSRSLQLKFAEYRMDILIGSLEGAQLSSEALQYQKITKAYDEALAATTSKASRPATESAKKALLKENLTTAQIRECVQSLYEKFPDLSRLFKFFETWISKVPEYHKVKSLNKRQISAEPATCNTEQAM